MPGDEISETLQGWKKMGHMRGVLVIKTTIGSCQAPVTALSGATEIYACGMVHNKHENKSLECSSNNDVFEAGLRCPMIFLFYLWAKRWGSCVIWHSLLSLLLCAAY